MLETKAVLTRLGQRICQEKSNSALHRLYNEDQVYMRFLKSRIGSVYVTDRPSAMNFSKTRLQQFYCKLFGVLKASSLSYFYNCCQEGDEKCHIAANVDEQHCLFKCVPL